MPAVPTVGEAVDRYLRELATSIAPSGQPFSPTTLRIYTGELRRWTDGADGVGRATPLAAPLAEAHQRQLAALRGRGAKGTTVANRDRVVRRFLAWCVETDLIDDHPLRRTRAARRPVPPLAALADETVRALLAAQPRDTWAGVRNVAAIMTLWRTGVRAAELASLDLADYDPADRRLVVRAGKGGKRRVVGIPDDCAGALDDWIERARGRAAGPLFPSGSGKRMSAQVASTQVGRWGRAAGLAGVHAHAFRHAFAVGALRAGLDIAVVSRLLGHTTLAMTLRYLRTLEDEVAVQMHAALVHTPAPGPTAPALLRPRSRRT